MRLKRQVQELQELREQDVENIENRLNAIEKHVYPVMPNKNIFSLLTSFRKDRIRSRTERIKQLKQEKRTYPINVLLMKLIEHLELEFVFTKAAEEDIKLRPKKKPPKKRGK